MLEDESRVQLDVLGRQLVTTCYVVCGAVFALGLLRGFSFLQMLCTSVSLAVAAVPEGLPTVATTTLAFGVSRLRKEGILARHLEAVETLGVQSRYSVWTRRAPSP